MTPAQQLASTLPPPPHVVLKQCQCGAAYTADEWAQLPRVGRMIGPVAGTELELRNCPCGSTISVIVPEDVHRRDEGDDAMAEVRAERDAEWRERSH